MLDAGFWAGMTLYPESKCTLPRAVDILENFGMENIWMNSACDWGISDPLAVAKCMQEMKKAATLSRNDSQSGLRQSRKIPQPIPQLLPLKTP